MSGPWADAKARAMAPDRHRRAVHRVCRGSLLRIDIEACFAAHGKGYGGAARKRPNSRAMDGARSATTSQTMRSSIPK